MKKRDVRRIKGGTERKTHRTSEAKTDTVKERGVLEKLSQEKKILFQKGGLRMGGSWRREVVTRTGASTTNDRYEKLAFKFHRSQIEKKKDDIVTCEAKRCRGHGGWEGKERK